MGSTHLPPGTGPDGCDVARRPVDRSLPQYSEERMVAAPFLTSTLFTIDLSTAKQKLSKSLTSGPPPSTAIVSSFRIEPGRVDEYRELAKEYILPAMTKINAPGYEVYRSIFGGADGWVTVRFADGVGEIDKGPALRRGLDPATYALVSQKLNELQLDVERQVQRLDTDLSFFTNAASNENE